MRHRLLKKIYKADYFVAEILLNSLISLNIQVLSKQQKVDLVFCFVSYFYFYFYLFFIFSIFRTLGLGLEVIDDISHI